LITTKVLLLSLRNKCYTLWNSNVEQLLINRGIYCTMSSFFMIQSSFEAVLSLLVYVKCFCFFNEYRKVLNIDSFNICFSPRSPLKVKEDDEVDNLDIKLGMKKKSKRVYQSQPPEVGLKISRSLKVSSLLQPYLIHNMTGICFIFHIHFVIWHTHIHKHGMHLFYIAYWYDIWH
jgi:hypothetical protein